jgi:hypothetical protein
MNLCKGRLLSFIMMAAAYGGYCFSQEKVFIGSDNLFVPNGFDSNDNVEVVVTGDLPNTCYLRPEGKVAVSDTKILITMMATKVSGEETNCIMAVVPYMVSVPLGQLSEGYYSVLVNPQTPAEKNGSLHVARPNYNSINNFPYANVMHIEAVSGQDKIILKGVHPSGCMEIERVEIYANDKRDTYSILPIIKATMPICDQMMTSFSYTLDLPPSPHAKQLLHVRKIDGTAINYLLSHTYRKDKKRREIQG